MITDVIKIETGAATKSVKDLRKELKDLKDQMLSAAQGSEEYNKALVKAANIQKQLKDQMQEVNNSAMDFGQYVGNAGKAMAGMTGAISAATAAMNLFGMENNEAAQEVTAMMTSLIGLTQGLQAIDSGVKAFKALTIAINASVAGMNALKMAIAATGIGALVVLIATVAANWDKWFGSTEKENDALQKTNNILLNLNDTLKAKERSMNFALEQMRIEGKLESEVQKERQKRLQQMLAMAQAAAQEAENNALLTQSLEEQEQAWKKVEEARAQVMKLQDLVNQAQDQGTLATMRESKASEEAAKTAANNAKTAAANLARYEKDMAMTRLKDSNQYSQEAYDIQMKYFDRLLSLYKKDSEEYRNVILEKTQYIKEYNNQYSDLLKDFDNSLKTEEQKLKERYDLLIEAAKKTGQDTQKIELWYQEETQKKSKEILDKFNSERKVTALDELQQQLDERYQILIAAAEKTGADTTKIQQWYLDETQKIIDNASKPNQIILDQWNQTMMTQQELEEQRLDEQYTKAIDAALAEGQDTTKIFEDYEKKKKDLADKYAKATLKMQLSRFKTMGNAVGDLLGNISDMMEEGSAAQKGMATAAATIQMLVGITTALSGAFTTKSGPWDYVLAGIQAAAIAAAGIANIQKINSVKPDGSGDTGGGSYVPNISIPSVVEGSGDFTQTVDGAMTEAAVSDNKVYVLESDITETQKKVEVTTANATF